MNNWLKFLGVLFAFVGPVCDAMNYRVIATRHGMVPFILQTDPSGKYYLDLSMSVVPVRVYVDGLEVKPSPVIASYEESPLKTGAASEPIVVVPERLSGLVFLDPQRQGPENSTGYVVGEHAEEVRIVYKTRFPSGGFGEETTCTIALKK